MNKNWKLIFIDVSFGLGAHVHDATLYILAIYLLSQAFFRGHAASRIGDLLTGEAKPILLMGGLGQQSYTA